MSDLRSSLQTFVALSPKIPIVQGLVTSNGIGCTICMSIFGTEATFKRVHGTGERKCSGQSRIIRIIRYHKTIYGCQVPCPLDGILSPEEELQFQTMAQWQLPSMETMETPITRATMFNNVVKSE